MKGHITKLMIRLNEAERYFEALGRKHEQIIMDLAWAQAPVQQAEADLDGAISAALTVAATREVAQ